MGGCSCHADAGTKAPCPGQGLQVQFQKLDTVQTGNFLAIQTNRSLQSRNGTGARGEAGSQDIVTDLTPRTVRHQECNSEFCDSASVVKPLDTDASVKLKRWGEVLGTMKTLVEAAREGKIVRPDANRLFSAVQEASRIGFSISASNPKLTRSIGCTLSIFFASEGACGNRVQREIVRRVCESSNLRDFDFVDMTQCITLVDVEESPSNEIFLSRAATVIGKHEVPEFRDALMSLGKILCVLPYLHQESLSHTYRLYKGMQPGSWAANFIAAAIQQYGPGDELVRTAGLNLQNEKDVMGILEQLRTPLPGGSTTVRGLRSIFSSCAEFVNERFGVLVLPHHTQVVCMLMLLQHIEGRDASGAGALIAEVGAGEGKSVIIATLALYCVVFLGKRVHIVADDESLAERGFRAFRDLFDRFEKTQGGPVQARLCTSTSRKSARFMADESVAVGVDEDADIVYCEARHVESFYEQLARRQGTDFERAYSDRILILHGVNALVADEPLNVPLFYESKELSAFATTAAEAVLQHAPPECLERLARTAQERRTLRQLMQAARVAGNWALHTDYALDLGSNRYVRVRDGRSRQESWSLALEFKNFSENLTDRITYNERLFIVSRPRVFKRYGQIVGLSGSAGGAAERQFLGDVYGANFFGAPKFLDTCRAAEARAVQSRGVVVEKDGDTQRRTTCERALACCAKAPVLIIARDRLAVTHLAQELQTAVSARGLDGNDVVRSLSWDLFEAQPEQFRENLFKCTQPTSKGIAKAFRVAVTDPRGGRALDCRVSDADADGAGGLTLIVNYVPKCRREWAQYLSRTATQDRHGQWMAVLNCQDYASEVQASGTNRKKGQPLRPETAVDTILAWGDAEAEARLRQARGQYHRGLRANELSEEVMRRRLLDGSPAGREAVVRLCGAHGRLSLEQIDALASKVPGLSPCSVESEALEVGPGPALSGRSIAILVDRSSSMLSDDADTLSRFNVCRECIAQIFEEHVQDQDQMALYTFETQTHETFPLTTKGPNRKRLAAAIRGLRAPYGLSRLFDGILECLQKLQKAGPGPKFLVTLTDGDDNRSVKQPNGEYITALLHGVMHDVSLIFITCGQEPRPQTVERMKYWAQLAQCSGQVGVHMAARDPAQLREAFATAAELMAELEPEA